MTVLSREKSRAMVLRNSINAKIAELNEKAEAESEKEIESAAEPTPVVEEKKVETVEIIPETPVETKVEEIEVKPEPKEVKEEKADVKPAAQDKPQDKPQEKKAKPEKQKQPEKKTEKAKPPVNPDAPVEVERTPTNKPNVWLIKFSDGTQRETYIPPEKPKKEITRVFNVPYNQKNAHRDSNQQRPQNGGTQRPGAPNRQLGANNTSVANAAQQFPIKQGQQRGKGGSKPGNDGSKKLQESGASKYQLMKRGYIVDETKAMTDDDADPRWRSAKTKQKGQATKNAIVIDHAVITTDPVPIKVLSEKIGKTGAEIIRTLFLLDIIKNINDSIDFKTAELVTAELSGDHPITLEFRPESTFEDELAKRNEEQDIKDLEKLEVRPPVVTIMGHVDHGKTSLLDYIRHANVTGGEAGGITQHIGAYTISLKGSPITFLDTPGHEAFTSMRARGAQVTDIAIIVVAADDGIMPQTEESIRQAKLAKVPIIIACNKIDKVSANPDRVLQQLTEYDLLPEEWGGDTPVVRVSAKTGAGVENLLEQILVQAEVSELRANPNRPAKGTVIEARVERGLGKVATVLVQKGTLKCGDEIIAGTCTGRVKIMVDDKGRHVKKAGPATPVSVTGWDELPGAGDIMDVVESDKFARSLADERRLRSTRPDEETENVSLDDLFKKASVGELKSVNLVIKTDVQGSLEAVKQALEVLGNDEVNINIVHGGVGAINESDVSHASTSKAIIIGFNVRPDAKAKAIAEQQKIEIRFYNVIYNAIEDIKAVVKGLQAPVYKEVELGSAEVRELFKISGIGTIAGSHVIDGKITRGAKARLVRNGTVIADTEIESLRHGKDDVKEIAKNYDCGIMLKNYPDVKVGDVIEAYAMEQVNEG